uniref:DUF3822 family protein n=1 Tax=Roseihalotalea indica TaxID=2867963 RepID=A0AA49GUT1_9BACT|nr:DUF3822 family protein [Tunicatimonas sp. TK19036]
MAHTVGNHTLIRKIKDPQFSIDHLNQYDLLLLAGRHDFQFCVTDAHSQRCLLLEDYIFPGGLSDLAEAYFPLFEGHHLLMAGYWNKVKLAVKNQHFTIVPDSYFSAENVGHYLTLATDTPTDQYTASYYRHKQSDAVMVFGAEKRLTERLKSFYPSQAVQLLHQGSAFIEGVQQLTTGSYYRTMYLHIGRQYFGIVVVEDKKLIFYNRFAYNSSGDIVKYTLTTLQKLGMDQNETKVHVWGNVSGKSDHYAALYRYIRQLSYGTKPPFLEFSHVFDEAPDHQYFDLYSMHLCE